LNIFESSIPGIVWPATPGKIAATLLAMQFQLQQSERLPHAELRARQFAQAASLLQHAYENVPFYRNRLAHIFRSARPSLTEENWAAIPILTKEVVQQHGHDFLGGSLPAAHGGVSKLTTSGSTGIPLEVYKTKLSEFFWQTVTLRDHLWHRRDFAKQMVAIRYFPDNYANYPTGAALDNWGLPVSLVAPTGPAVSLNIKTDVSDQIRWLQRQEPGYFLTYPSNLQEILRTCLREGQRIPPPIQVRTVGETVGQELRELCRKVWGVAIVDMYSSQEAGYIALQCPQSDRYHVQSETLLVEILDEAGRPCAQGEIGRVVVTPLHNFAMPLIRYFINDYAEAGEGCPCGRTLPVLNKIMGRQRNMLTLPNGERRWPLFTFEEMAEAASFRQFRFIQKSLSRIEAHFAVERPFSAAEQDAIAAIIRQDLGAPFQIDFVYCEVIARGKNCKHEDFKSEIA